jgi:hypothetical protein
MDADQHIWRVWAGFLQRWGVERWVASLLEAAGPLNVLGAQVVFLGQPFLGQSYSQDQLNALARLFEDATYSQAFVKFLRETPSQ